MRKSPRKWSSKIARGVQNRRKGKKIRRLVKEAPYPYKRSSRKRE